MSWSSNESICRVCEQRFNNEEMVSHELSCLQRSQEKQNTDCDGKPSEEVNEHTRKNSSDKVATAVQVGNTNEEEVSLKEENYNNRKEVLPLPGGSQNLSESKNEANPSQKHQSDTCSHQRIAIEKRPNASMRYDRKKEDNLFPPTKKYSYYPVTCEYCRERFQPDELEAHQREEHLDEIEYEKPVRKRAQSTAAKNGNDSERSDNMKYERTKSVGGLPRRLQVCYICNRLYGSKSIKIHEPKCLEKWRKQNKQLPPERRAPEPKKPDPVLSKVAAGEKEYDVPELDPKAEAAFESHLSTLVPCTHCSRTFSPDRIQKHESCCIERPKTRQYVTPEDGEIKR